MKKFGSSQNYERQDKRSESAFSQKKRALSSEILNKIKSTSQETPSGRKSPRPVPPFSSKKPRTTIVPSRLPSKSSSGDSDSSLSPPNPSALHSPHSPSSSASLSPSAFPHLKQKIIQELQTLSELYQAKQDTWRSNGYKKAVQALQNTSFLSQHDLLLHLPYINGIGKSIQEKIKQIIQTGKHSNVYMHLQNDQEASVISLFCSVHGIGAHTARMLYRNNCRTLGDLRNCTLLTPVQRLGLLYHEEVTQRIPREEVKRVGDIIRFFLLYDPFLREHVKSFYVTGSYRRGKESCGDMDFLLIKHRRSRPVKGIMHRLLLYLKEVEVICADLMEVVVEEDRRYGNSLEEQQRVVKAFATLRRDQLAGIALGRARNASKSGDTISLLDDNLIFSPETETTCDYSANSVCVSSPILRTDTLPSLHLNITHKGETEKWKNYEEQFRTEKNLTPHYFFDFVSADISAETAAVSQASAATNPKRCEQGETVAIKESETDGSDELEGEEWEKRGEKGRKGSRGEAERETYLGIGGESVKFSESLDFLMDENLMQNKQKFDDYFKNGQKFVYPVQNLTKHIKRRIDIKIYNEECEPFALLYFTGSAHFNRSMRLFAKKKRLLLDDCGLYPTTHIQKERVWKGQSAKASTEEDIFRILELPYKHPHERDAVDVTVTV